MGKLYGVSGTKCQHYNARTFVNTRSYSEGPLLEYLGSMSYLAVRVDA